MGRGRAALLVSGDESQDQTHGFPTAGTERLCGLRYVRLRCCAKFHGQTGVELNAHAIGFGGRMTEAVVTDGAQSAGQDVAQVTGDKLHARDGGSLSAIALVPVFPVERDGGVGDVDQTRIVDGGAGHVSAEVFERAATGTGRLNVNAPVHVPDRAIDLPVVFLQQPVKVLAKGGLQLWQINEELWVLHAYELSAGIQTDTRHHAMDVRMKPDLLIPGVKRGSEAVDRGAQSLVGRELLAQGSGDGGKEQVERFLGVRAEEETAQFRGQREGDEEVSCVDEFALFPLNPFYIGGTATKRAGLVIAGMKSQVLASAWFAVKEVSAQRRGAAMSDSPDGPALRWGERRFGFKKRRQKLAQHVDDREACRHGKINVATCGRDRP